MALKMDTWSFGQLRIATLPSLKGEGRRSPRRQQNSNSFFNSLVLEGLAHGSLIVIEEFSSLEKLSESNILL